MTTALRRIEFSPYLKREPVTLALLTGLAIVFFLAVSALSRVYSAQRESLAERWAARGVNDLNAARYRPAVEDFRTALLYDRDSSAYQLSLAEALMGLHRESEAEAYLVNVWEREPDNGLASLQLARIATSRGETERALRFYHNAIYGTWPGNPDTAMRKARLELIAYLMRIDARSQADAELIDLAASSVAGDAQQQIQLGQMFAAVGDDQRALGAFQAALQRERRNPQALAGAGEATFKLGMFPMAERYLARAHALAPGDAQVARRLNMAQIVLHWDPFRPQVPVAERRRIAIEAFAASGDRLKSCAPPTQQDQALQKQWQKLEPSVTDRAIGRQPDLVDTVMQLAFDIEKQTAGNCGPQNDADRALLLVANLHEED
ncbi:MAG: tetratricopeptide repeat protein [Acidobacteriota bacterium]